MSKTPPSRRMGSVNRVRIGQNPPVDVKTKKQLNGWMKQGVSLSVLLDRLVSHAKRTKFSPADDCI